MLKLGPTGKPLICLFDCDGTLFNVSAIRHHVLGPCKNFDAFHAAAVDAPPITWVTATARLRRRQGYAIGIVTARKAMWRHHTAWALAMNDVPSDVMWMRANPDQRKDVLVKTDMAIRIESEFDVHEVLDDNPSVVIMWRARGHTVRVVPGWED